MNFVAMIFDSTVVANIEQLIASVYVELLVFVAGMVAYFTLFGTTLPKNAKQQKNKVKDALDKHASNEQHGDFQSNDELGRVFQTAVEIGDHRSVLRCWSAMKKTIDVPSIPLAQVVESMQRFKKDVPFILRELKSYFKKYPSECDISVINDLLESLAKRLDSELMDKIIEMLPTLDLTSDQRTYEIFLGMHFTTRNFQEVKKLVSEMKSRKIPFTTRAISVIIKTELKVGNLDQALPHFRELRNMWIGEGSPRVSPSTAPQHIVSQLVELVCREHRLMEFLPELAGVPITDDTVSIMLNECVRQRDVVLTQRVESLARKQGAPLSDMTYTLLIKAFSADGSRVRALLDEISVRKQECSADLALAVIGYCSHTKDVALVDRLYQRTGFAKQPQVLSALIRLYADNDCHEKACDVYENELQRVQFVQVGASMQRSMLLDTHVERSLMNAALRCGRSNLAKRLLDSPSGHIAKHITMIRNCAAENNLQGAMRVFDSLQQSGAEMNTVIYNTVLDACVECRDLSAAESWMQQMKEAGMVDVVSFNTLIKAHLIHQNFTKARAVIDQMKAQGVQPNRVTFNELINAMVTKGGEAERARIWDTIAEMKAADVKPNQVTCSILLKSLNGKSRHGDVMKTMDLLNAMDEAMDEVLLSSVVEACVRIGKPELLTSKLRQLEHGSGITVNGSHTFGSLIKAYGHARDIDGVWRCWKEMRSRHIRPTSITLGCMVEAVVSNGDTEGAYELIHQMHDDEQCRDALNSVIYCSVLKGFTREKKIERVWSVYDEMVKKGIELSIVTYNTLIDACARCGRMEHVDEILSDMSKHNIKPNVITYSTMLKGHCQMGSIQTAFSVLEEMKRDTKLKPDEIMYNSLLDGCAQNNLVDEGLGLLQEMQSERVTPSNFTLSILVKMMNRARKLNSAFSLVDEITSKYGFKANVHVYTNLIQACISNRQLQKGMNVLETMMKEQIAPENRTYAILVRACISHGQFEQAIGLLRGALGLLGSSPILATSPALATCQSLDYALVNEALVSLAEYKQAQEAAVSLLSDIKQQKPRVRIDSSTQRRVMGLCSGTEGGTSKGAGKGWNRFNH
jgi:pentatricopeptide repeat protein